VIACPHCQGVLMRKSTEGNKLKARTSMCIMHRTGEVEINCGSCGKGVLLGKLERVVVSKAAPPQRLIVRKFVTP